MSENLTPNKSSLMDKVVALSKRRGFIYPGSEIYGGLANTYDYGPSGAELLRNIKNLWWEYFIQRRPDMVGLDGSIISHHKIWEASGHVAGFSDAMIDCRNCKARMRADHLIENFIEGNADKLRGYTSRADFYVEGLGKDLVDQYLSSAKVEGLTTKQLGSIINQHKIPCPNCEKFDWTKIRKFNLLFPVQLGIVEGDQGMGYLRGETAQQIFTNFKNVVDSTRVKLPFGIGQIGKSFRNEITPGNSIFRTIEFEQGEIEYFFDHKNTDWEKLFDEWKSLMWEFVAKELGVDEKKLRWREHADEERSFYSKKTLDLEYKFPFGYKELWGLAYRTDYDLKQHIEFSKKDLVITDPQSGEKIVPHVIEPAVGINRLLLMVLIDSYQDEKERVVLKIDPKLAPNKIAVFPLLGNKPELIEKAKGLFEDLSKSFTVAWDDRGNIGKRYASQDEIGTPWCVTVDFESLENDTVTVRNRDTADQKRHDMKDLKSYFDSKLV